MQPSPKRQQMTEILMERIAWQMMQMMPTQDIARLNNKSVATIQEIRRRKDFDYVLERVKRTSFAHLEHRGQQAVDRAIQMARDNAPGIMQMILDLAYDANVSNAVRLAAGLHTLNKAGVQSQAVIATTNPFLDGKVIDIDRETTQQIL